jgi:hypothetical protein
MEAILGLEITNLNAFYQFIDDMSFIGSVRNADFHITEFGITITFDELECRNLEVVSEKIDPKLFMKYEYTKPPFILSSIPLPELKSAIFYGSRISKTMELTIYNNKMTCKFNNDEYHIHSRI